MRYGVLFLGGAFCIIIAYHTDISQPREIHYLLSYLLGWIVMIASIYKLTPIFVKWLNGKK